MLTLVHQRCFIHALREAAARCPECGRFFCRECVTPHEDRVVCAACLARLAKGGGGRPTVLLAALRMIQGLAGLATAWLVFYLAGRLLLALPDSFHEGTYWQGSQPGSGAGPADNGAHALHPSVGGKD
jgi:hypothetical protein